MKSKIAELIQMEREPVAVIRAESAPEGALMFKAGQTGGCAKGCTVMMINAASKGKVTAITDETMPCNGGKSGAGIREFKLGIIEYFLSNGEKGPREGEFYKQTPELAKEYIVNMPKVSKTTCLIFKPLSKASEADNVEAVIFLADADGFSGLVTLANFDQPVQDSVKLNFGAGCAQMVLYAIHENEIGGRLCFAGLTDPSARLYLDKNLLGFSIPYCRYVEMEKTAEESFLKTATWKKLLNRK